ncbi:response regulator transcription factor [Pararoseomonas indoligenes]|uniref:Response regulator transcription factor n=1 Tax=Roseomonas indoligenes TaxID=2820811 RepID=A0A940S8M1_9PROT|nr:response regulator transcription factor [Pararoseomonas indoligenes]MBP0494247.1 response regulator transcription factor [Pararoseomonas indoligenes]
MARILIVDDDPAIRDVVRFALSRAGYATLEAADGAAGLAAAREALPDLVVLDVMLPEMDGTEMCRALRASGGAAAAIPVLFLSSRDDEVDRVVGLEIGGDDYLTKPFSPRELVARVRAVLRRGAPVAAVPAPVDEVLRHGRLALDPGTARVTWDGREVVLTATEFGLLRTLMRRPGRVLNRDALMDGAYTVERIVSDRTIDSHVRRLRAKFAALGAAPVETLPGFGYRLGPCD